MFPAHPELIRNADTETERSEGLVEAAGVVPAPSRQRRDRRA